jgi:xylulokinase
MYLGIDIGTSSVKAVIVDDKDTVVEQASAPLNVSRPQAGWSEQNPADWWVATNAAVKALPAKERKAVRAVGLSGQMHGATLLDAADKPLRPAILWNDGRSEQQCATLEKAEPRSREITGNIAMPGFTAPKLVWVREHEPAVFKDTRCVLLPKDYVRLLMTGEKASDCSDAAGTLWVDVGKRRWSPEMLAATGLNESHMPRLVEGSDVTGSLRKEVASDWGMDSAGGRWPGDAPQNGIASSSRAMLSVGVLQACCSSHPKFQRTPRAVHAFCHCLPGVASDERDARRPVDWAVKLAARKTPPNCSKVESARPSTARRSSCRIFRERTCNDPQARGVLFGLNRLGCRGHWPGRARRWPSRLRTGSTASSKQVPASTRSRSSAVARVPWWGGRLSAALKRPLP